MGASKPQNPQKFNVLEEGKVLMNVKFKHSLIFNFKCLNSAHKVTDAV